MTVHFVCFEILFLLEKSFSQKKPSFHIELQNDGLLILSDYLLIINR